MDPEMSENVEASRDMVNRSAIVCGRLRSTVAMSLSFRCAAEPRARHSLRATKQTGSEFILQAPYLLAQRRLLDVKPRGSAAEVQLLGNGGQTRFQDAK